MPDEPNETEWWNAPIVVVTMVASACLSVLFIAVTVAAIRWLI